MGSLTSLIFEMRIEDSAEMAQASAKVARLALNGTKQHGYWADLSGSCGGRTCLKRKLKNIQDIGLHKAL
jgi:hypothetical protein